MAKSKTNKTRQVLETEPKILKQHNMATAISEVLRNLIRYGAFVLIAWQCTNAVIALSGKTTHADISFNGNLAVGTASNTSAGISSIAELFEILPWAVTGLAIIFGVAGIAFGRKQAKLRQETIKRFRRYKEAEEMRIDPGRTSSRLSIPGEPEPEDLI